VRSEYDLLAEEYDARWTTYIDRTVDETLRRLHVRGGESLLDVGCGSGAMLRRIVDGSPTTRCAGVDLSAAMIGNARGRLPSSVVLAVADAEHLPFAGNTFDAVVSTSSLHFWPQPVAALAEIRRVLRPGGRVVITDWCDDFIMCRVCDRYLRWRNPAHRDVHSGDECTRLLREAGLQVDSLDRYKVSWLWGMMTATARKQVLLAGKNFAM